MALSEYISFELFENIVLTLLNSKFHCKRGLAGILIVLSMVS